MVSLDIEIAADLTVRRACNFRQQTKVAIREAVSGIYDIVIHIEPHHNVEQDEKFGVSKGYLE